MYKQQKKNICESFKTTVQFYINNIQEENSFYTIKPQGIVRA